jgi:hypothetical protein
VHNVRWLGEQSETVSEVEETDFRAGLVFSTSFRLNTWNENKTLLKVRAK